ncbi:MAG TPA: 50S ribosomal protein L10 [Candidatus Binataceae bacterium]|nr:50S ribosomal protein L10 [Candidatus Binataceae bacterium]
MRKEQKTALVADLNENLGRANLAIVSEYRQLNAGETAEMRRKLRAARGVMKVAKNTLIRRAVADGKFSALGDKLGGPVGVILSFGDPIEMAKTVAGFRDLGDKFKLRGGVLDGKPLTAEEVQQLASLPSREVIMAQLLGLLQAPATRLARLLNEPGSALARLIDAVGRKAGGAAA